ncbi:MAG: T9SS type A sorting domain-containing protein [Bacteroidales bacterium]
MKKSLLGILLFLFSFILLSQNSFRLYHQGMPLINHDSLYFYLDSSQYTVEYMLLGIENISNTDKNVKVKKNEILIVPGSENTFCWGMCYTSSVYISTKYITIQAHTTNNADFYGEYYPKGNLGTSIIMYTFFDINNPDDSVSVVAFYIATPVNTENFDLCNNYSLYPNPSSGKIYLKKSFTNEAIITIYNPYGIKVYESLIENNEIDISMLSDGLYIYRILVDGEIKGSDYLLIRSNK